MKRPFIIHPFLFAIFPIIFFSATNIAELTEIGGKWIILGIIAVMIITLLFALLFWLILNTIFKNKYKSAIFTSMFLLMFFSYGHLYEVMRHLGYSVTLGSGELSRNIYYLYLFVWLMLFILFIYFSKKKRSFFVLTRFLNIASCILIGISFLIITSYAIKRTTWLTRSSQEIPDAKPTVPETKNVLPDIYYIILDGYCAESTLKEYYHYDNGDFINYLKKKGFYIASESVSNYAFTILSLASSLNMQYLDELSHMVDVDSNDLSLPLYRIRNNKVASFLKSKGYDVIHIGWNVMHIEWISSGYSFLPALMKTTVISPFISYLGFDEFALKRKYLLLEFSKLAQTRRANKPIFVYAHLMLPSAPYVFGPAGEKVAVDDGSPLEDKYYIDQLIFTNKKVKLVIEEILRKSKTPPIIILQGDHGRGNTKAARMRILNAYYLPQKKNSLLYNSITPVNTFRFIFNSYFGANYKLLDDQSYFSWWIKPDKPYKFINVTAEVDYDKENHDKENIEKLYSSAILALYTNKIVDNKYNINTHNIKIINDSLEQAAYFNGKNSDITTALRLSDLEGFTIMFWAKPNKEQNANIVTIFDNGHDEKQDFVLQSVDTNNNTYTFHFFGSDLIFNLPPDVWTHISVTIDLKDKFFCVYLNGKKQAYHDFPQIYKFGSRFLTFGKLAEKNDRYFKGAMGEIFIWPYAVDEEKIRLLYKYSKIKGMGN